jgi:ribosomal protein L31E
MAKKKEITQEREYIINLRSEVLKAPRYKRTPKAIKALKMFIARHMRVAERDVEKVKLSKWLNLEMWHRGIQNPPMKVKVKVKKVGENVMVDLAEMPKALGFIKAREDRQKKESEGKKEAKKSVKEKEEKKEEKEKTPEEKQEETEKEQSGKEAELKHAHLEAKEQKHLRGGSKKEPRVHRMALEK